MDENAPDETGAWTAVGVVAEMQPILIGGINLWERQWDSLHRAVMLPHPSYPSERHRLNVYRIDAGVRQIIFAAGELSSNVWGFYVPGRLLSS